MHLQVITPEKIVLEDEARYVSAPGTLGDFGVLPGHEPFVSTLKPGTVIIELTSGERKEFPVTGGIAEITPDKCTLLVDAA